MKKYEKASAEFIEISSKDIIMNSIILSDKPHDFGDDSNSSDAGDLFN